MNFDEWAKSIFKHGTDAEFGIARAAWDDATKSERDECAKLCEAKADAMWAWWDARADPIDQGRALSADELADEIRMRSNVQIEGQPASGLSRSNDGLGTEIEK